MTPNALTFSETLLLGT